jgi:hypothetical protein
MPRVGVGEDKNSFVSRCISVRQNEKPDEDVSQSAAICHQIWRDTKKKKKSKK